MSIIEPARHKRSVLTHRTTSISPLRPSHFDYPTSLGPHRSAHFDLWCCRSALRSSSALGRSCACYVPRMDALWCCLLLSHCSARPLWRVTIRRSNTSHCSAMNWRSALSVAQLLRRAASLASGHRAPDQIHCSDSLALGAVRRSALGLTMPRRFRRSDTLLMRRSGALSARRSPNRRSLVLFRRSSIPVT